MVQKHEPSLTERASGLGNVETPVADASKPRKRKKFVGSKAGPRSFASSSVVAGPSYTVSPALAQALTVLPSNYTFEISKTIAMIRKHNVHTVGLQMPEGLQMFACVVGDILARFAYEGEPEEDQQLEVVILGDVTYGACCVDDYTARALGVELLVHYGHSCLVPMSTTSSIRTLYVFVEIAVDIGHAETTVVKNLPSTDSDFHSWWDTLHNALPGSILPTASRLAITAGDAATTSAPTTLALVSTIQFSTALSHLSSALNNAGFRTILPRSHPLSPGEILGCTAPTLTEPVNAILYLGDGRFHLEAMLLANPGVPAFRYDPYSKKFTREAYDHAGMRAVRRAAISTAATTPKNWGIVLGTLGRQGSPGHLQALLDMRRDAIPILMSELSPAKLALFGDELGAVVQTSCPRLSIDWGDAFGLPVLSVWEAGVANGVWNVESKDDREQGKHPMDFYMRGTRWAEARKTGKFIAAS